MSNSDRVQFMQECYLLRLKAQLQVGGGFPEHLIKAVREDAKLLDEPEEASTPGQATLGVRVMVVLALEVRGMITETGGPNAVDHAVRVEAPQWLVSMFETLQGGAARFYGVPLVANDAADRIRVVYATGTQKVPLHVVPALRNMVPDLRKAEE